MSPTSNQDDHFPFLLLPGEIRNQIYSYLYWWKSEPDHAGGLAPFHIHANGNGEFDDLLSLMRTNRREPPFPPDPLSIPAIPLKTPELNLETTPFLYSPLYHLYRDGRTPSGRPSATTSWTLRFLSPHGPARHLRKVCIQLGRVQYARDDWPRLVLSSLARNARQLERLDIMLHHLPHVYRMRVDGFWVWPPEYSWVDPPLEIPTAVVCVSGSECGSGCGSESESESVSSVTSGEDPFLPIVKFLAPRDEVRQGIIMTKINESIVGKPYRHELQGGFWDDVEARLVMLEEEKRFWGRMVIGIVEEFSSILREFNFVARVDKKWMAAVADAAGVRVRAKRKLTDSEWIVVEPGALGTGVTDRATANP